MIAEVLVQVWIEINSFLQASPLPTQTAIVVPQIPAPEVFILPPDTAIPLPSRNPKPAVKAVLMKTSKLTVKSILEALNSYRAKNGAGTLQIDENLQTYAQSRANYLKSIGKLDGHAKHKEFMANNGFNKLGFNAVAENQGYNFKGGATDLIESFYAKSSGHNKNQLNVEYTHVGIGINGPFTNLIFGGRKR